MRICLGKLILPFGILCLGMLVPRPWEIASAQQPAAGQTYVTPSLWRGVLILQANTGPGELTLSEPDLKLLSAALAKEPAKCVLAIESGPAESPALDKLLTDSAAQTTRIPPAQICPLFKEDTPTAIWADCEAIWLDTDEATSLAIRQLDDAAHRRLIGCLERVLAQGGFVRIRGDLQWLGDSSREMRSSLLAGCLVRATHGHEAAQGEAAQDSATPSAQSSRLQLEFAAGARLALANRQAINISEHPVTMRLPPTAHYPQELAQTLRAGDALDWVQWQRAKLERQHPLFPGAERVSHQLAGGSLVIGGGGGMPAEVWQRFVELAGGSRARIVILPTAVDAPTDAPSLESRLLRQAGAEHIVTLPQTQLSAIEDPAFLAELEQATGVWFGGGRQWRFVDAYWGTPAWEKLGDVCRRGGVIGGSSAGATIQGDLLVRGAPAGNHIMIAEGYRRGLGLLPNVAIDQHFSQRNRFRELETCLADFPATCGIGIDEQTALVVTAPGHCEVLGNGSVWRYASYEVGDSLKPDAATRASMRQEFKSGSAFALSGD